MFSSISGQKISKHSMLLGWVSKSGWNSNYRKFLHNINELGMSLEEAAWNTWTGRQLRDREWHGSVRVTSSTKDDGTHVFEVEFSKE